MKRRKLKWFEECSYCRTLLTLVLTTPNDQKKKKGREIMGESKYSRRLITAICLR